MYTYHNNYLLGEGYMYLPIPCMGIFSSQLLLWRCKHEVTKTVHIPAHIQLKLNLVKVLMVTLELKLTIDNFTTKFGVSISF